MPRRIVLVVAAAAAAALSLSSGRVFALPGGAPHAAACVAALKSHEHSLVAAGGGAADDGELLDVVRSGIAIIGTQYLAGLSEVEARQLLGAAEKDFEALAPTAAESLSAACLQEGRAAYRNASPLERGLISHAAQRRIKRLKSG